MNAWFMLRPLWEHQLQSDKLIEGESLWQLKPDVNVISTNEDFVLISWLGQRTLLRVNSSKFKNSVEQALAALRNPICFSDLQKEISPPLEESQLKRLMKSLLEKRLLFSAEKNQTSKNSIPESEWSPYLRIYSDSQEETAELLTKLSKMRTVLHTHLKLPLGFSKMFSSMDNDLKPANFDLEFWHVLLLPASEDMQALSESAQKTSARILPVLVDPFGAVVGPLTGGVGRPCLQCISKRSKTNQPRVDNSVSNIPVEGVEKRWPSTYWQKLAAILQEEIFKLHSGLLYSSLNRGAYVFDFLNHRSDHEDVFPIPGCPCSKTIEFVPFEGASPLDL